MQIRGMRLISDFAAAALAPACILTALYLYGQFIVFDADDPYIWIRTRTVSVFFLAMSTLHVVVLGIPCYFVLRWRNALRAWSVVASGFALGAIPGAIISWPMQYAGTQHSSGINGVTMIADGVTTTAGWIQFFSEILFLGLCGLSGATMFWLVKRSRREALWGMSAFGWWIQPVNIRPDNPLCLPELPRSARSRLGLKESYE